MSLGFSDSGPEGSASAGATHEKRLRILVVDDEPTVRNVMRTQLTEEGLILILIAKDGAIAGTRSGDFGDAAVSSVHAHTRTDRHSPHG
jgi:CheY-like chemotaxis protein